ncbi:MAG: hypothetical protein NT121_15390 [Chloroflexi bacterium]|nr:hypothetical protein [Chloroflexota bacterium]
MKPNKEIVITPLQIVIGLLVFMGLALAGFALAPQLTKLPLFAGPTPAGQTAEAAARTGAEVFFSVDAKAGQDAWISKVCDVSTENGCQLTKKVYGPMLWPSIEKLGLRLSCKVTSAALAQELTQENAPATQAWKLTSTCTNLDTGETSGGAAKVFVAQTAAAGWKLERIGFDQEPE